MAKASVAERSVAERSDGEGAPMAAGLRVEVIRERCLSSANCVATAPGFFDLDDDGIATVVGEAGDDAVASVSEAAVKNAVAECPAAALRLLGPI